MSNRRLLVLVSVVASLTAVIACSSSSNEVRADSYDSSCAVDTDCVEATFGGACDLVCNPNGAINARERDKYISDFADKSKDCPEMTYVRDPCEDARRPYAPRCTAGRCTIVEVAGDAGITSDSGDAGADG